MWMVWFLFLWLFFFLLSFSCSQSWFLAVWTRWVFLLRAVLMILVSIMVSIAFCNCASSYYALNLAFSAALFVHSVLKSFCVEIRITESFRLKKSFKIKSSCKPDLDQCFTFTCCALKCWSVMFWGFCSHAALCSAEFCSPCTSGLLSWCDALELQICQLCNASVFLCAYTHSSWNYTKLQMKW